jgi:serine/threonine protein kinase
MEDLLRVSLATNLATSRPFPGTARNLREVGRDTYVGIDAATNTEVYIQKISMPTATSDRCDLLHEVVVPLALNHPGIVRLNGFHLPAPGSDCAVLMTEFMPKGTLRKALGGPSLGPTELSKIIFGIAVTMQAVHSRGLCHRDLSTENVLLDAQREPRLCGFSLRPLARQWFERTRAIAVHWNIFSAPELCDDPYARSQPADVYAFGSIVYLCVARQPAASFARLSAFQMMSKVRAGYRCERPERMPDNVWELIENCWRADNRPTFDWIVNEMRGSDAFALPGTARWKYHEYQQRMGAAAEEQGPVDAALEQFGLAGPTSSPEF